MLWFFLNLLLLGAIFLILFNFRFALSSFSRGPSYRIETVARLINEETNEKTRAERDEILKAYGELNRIEFFLFDHAGRQLGGREIELPTARGRAAEQVWVWQSSKPASKRVKGEFQRAIEFRTVWR